MDIGGNMLPLEKNAGTSSSLGLSELPIDKALSLAIDVIGNKKNQFIDSFYRAYQYSDDPKIYQYHSQVKDKSIKMSDRTNSSGLSFFSKEVAALKCLVEALERHSYSTYDKKTIVFAKSAELKYPAIPISSIVSFSDKQRKEDPSLKLDPNGKFGWVLGKNLLSRESAYLPAQLVYLSYKRKLHEDLIRLPISTGCAAGSLPTAAICRGIYEIIERDAFMITYLNKLSVKRVLIENSKNKDILYIVKEAHDYKFQLFLFDITTDIPVPTFLAILMDKTGIGPAISVGAKSHLKAEEAMLGAIQEVFNPRKWIRRENDNKDNSKAEKELNMTQRGILWSSLKEIKHLDFLLKSSATIAPTNYSKDNYFWQEQFDKLLQIFSQMNYHVYSKDITPEKINESPFCVYQVIIPELHPLYLYEDYPYLGGKRLYKVPVELGLRSKENTEDTLHNFPHPFL